MKNTRDDEQPGRDGDAELPRAGVHGRLMSNRSAMRSRARVNVTPPEPYATRGPLALEDRPVSVFNPRTQGLAGESVFRGFAA
jgi:hypothetical protein